MIYLLLSSGILIIIITYKWYTQLLYTKKLFIRAWTLERTLMQVYDRCSLSDQKIILNVLDNIDPL
jgi:hypothetical protein